MQNNPSQEGDHAELITRRFSVRSEPVVSNLITQPARQAHNGDLADDIDTALENVTVGLGRAGESIYHYAEDVIESFDHPEPGSAQSVKHALRTIRAHPIAAVSTAISALIGLAFAKWRTKAA